MARRLVVVLAALSILVAPLALSAGASPDAGLAQAAKAKKAKKCRANQVAVTVGKRKRVCRPVRRFVPRPHAGDTQMAVDNRRLLSIWAPEAA